MTTQELVKRLREGLPYVVSATVWAESDALKAEAASRLSEMEGEIKRLREALQRIGACHYEYVEGVAVGEGPPVFSAEMMARIARAALEHQQKGEKL